MGFTRHEAKYGIEALRTISLENCGICDNDIFNILISVTRKSSYSVTNTSFPTSWGMHADHKCPLKELLFPLLMIQTNRIFLMHFLWIVLLRIKFRILSQRPSRRLLAYLQSA